MAGYLLFLRRFVLNPPVLIEWIDYFSSALPRAGVIQAALNLDVTPSAHLQNLVIKAEGANGQLPNLDLINIVNVITSRMGILENRIVLAEGPTMFFPFYIPPVHYTLINFMINQALGIPTGDHGIFNLYRIDAITLKALPGDNRQTSMENYPKLIEAVVRSLNNLIEHLHQSFYYYLLPHVATYISIGEYMISLGLVVAGMTLHVLLTLFQTTHILYAVSIVVANQIMGAILFAVPLVLRQRIKLGTLSLQNEQV